LNPRPWIIAALALALTGCTLGPNYHRPQVSVPDQFRNAPAAAGPNSIADTKWFDLFQDDTLKQLVTTALANNFDLRIAAERVLEARAQYGITHAGLFPTLDGQGQFTASRTSSVGSFNFIPKGSNLSTSYTQAALSFSWEIDLWGRIRRLSEAARAQ
jgi:multidrug efflux system outer membrane protein